MPTIHLHILMCLNIWARIATCTVCGGGCGGAGDSVYIRVGVCVW